MTYQVSGSRVEWNPTAARLPELTEKMPNASVTEFGNVVVKARVDSRSTRSTYIVEDSTNSRGQTISRAQYDRVSGVQDAYIAQSHLPVVDGYIGSDPQFRTRARLIMEARLKRERKEFLGSFPGWTSRWPGPWADLRRNPRS